MPPPLAKAIAGQILKAIGTKPKRPAKELAMGETGLLRMSLAQASAYWGVPSPIGQRDRKSGVKKAKQVAVNPDQISLPVN